LHGREVRDRRNEGRARAAGDAFIIADLGEDVNGRVTSRMWQEEDAWLFLLSTEQEGWELILQPPTRSLSLTATGILSRISKLKIELVE
jgi:hypothetical protein